MRSRPRLGVFEIGWPKSDSIFDEHGQLSSEFFQLSKRNLGLPDRPHNILFAPSWETTDFLHFKSFAISTAKLNANLLIKYGPHYAPGLVVPDDPRIARIDSLVSIMECLAVADVVISEESNVLVEALLFGLPTIAVTDWNVPAMLGYPERAPCPPPFSFMTAKETLADTLDIVIKNLEFFKSEALINRSRWFSNLGRSSSLIMDLVEAVLCNKSLPIAAIRSDL